MTDPASTYQGDQAPPERVVKGRANGPLCDYCGGPFTPEPENVNKQRFCSTQCKTAWHKRESEKQRNAETVFAGEMQFGGWGDGHRAGPWIKLFLADSDDLAPFRGLTERKSKQAGHRFMVAVAEIGDDERPVTQPAEPEKKKGGVLARSAVMVCKDERYQAYSKSEWERYGDVEGEFESAEEAAKQWTLLACAIASRSELDHDPRAARAFSVLMKNYRIWLEANDEPTS